MKERKEERQKERKCISSLRFSKVCLLPDVLCKIFTKLSSKNFEPVRPTAVLCISSVKFSKICLLPNLLYTISTKLFFERFHRRDRLQSCVFPLQNSWKSACSPIYCIQYLQSYFLRIFTGETARSLVCLLSEILEILPLLNLPYKMTKELICENIISNSEAAYNLVFLLCVPIDIVFSGMVYPDAEWALFTHIIALFTLKRALCTLAAALCAL